MVDRQSLVVAQAAVVGLQVVGRHILHSPIPWTEEIARLLLGVADVRRRHRGACATAQHPRVTALVRLLAEPQRAGASIAACGSCSSPSSSA